MYTPRPDPRQRPTDDEYTWRSVLLVLAAVGFVPLALWSVTNPLSGAVIATLGVGVLVGAGHLIELSRCLRYCGGFTLELTDRVQVTVTRPAATAGCSVD